MVLHWVRDEQSIDYQRKLEQQVASVLGDADAMTEEKSDLNEREERLRVETNCQHVQKVCSRL